MNNRILLFYEGIITLMKLTNYLGFCVQVCACACIATWLQYFAAAYHCNVTNITLQYLQFSLLVLLKTVFLLKLPFALKLQFQSCDTVLKFPINTFLEGKQPCCQGLLFSLDTVLYQKSVLFFPGYFGALLREQFIVDVKFQHGLFKIRLLFLPVNSPD